MYGVATWYQEKPGINLSRIVHMTDADTVGILSTFTLKLSLRYLIKNKIFTCKFQIPNICVENGIVSSKLSSKFYVSNLLES